MKTLESDKLFKEILAARERVYALGDVTPLQALEVPLNPFSEMRRGESPDAISL